MIPVPSLQRERTLWERGQLRIVGVDEVGVGSLAGPVVAAAVHIPTHCQIITGVRDSKTLSAFQRERLFAEITRQAVAVGIGAASVNEIEQMNILNATYLAMQRALARLGRYDHALIDGRKVTNIDLGPHTAIVDGDASSYAIACASIVAKVMRDRLMKKLALRFPVYSWERNAGYATREHLAALRRFGVTPFHRRSYAPVQAVLSQATTLEMC
ncbi:MAG: ribonuclease HII [Candidatus Tectomicrobia bacterium]|nr:ribonuclease HII [Candidatus Tectomicrobia bacterium]